MIPPIIPIKKPQLTNEHLKNCKANPSLTATFCASSDATHLTNCSKNGPREAPYSSRGVSQRSSSKIRYDEITGRPILPRTYLKSTRTVASITRKLISFDQEELWALALSPGKRLLGAGLIFRGTVDSCLTHPREIFKYLYQVGASSYILVHNHPSGDSSPSEHDWDTTYRLLEISGTMGIPLVDHVIVTERGFRSLAAGSRDIFDVFSGPIYS